MEKEIERCYTLSYSFEKITIKQYEDLLKNKSKTNKEAFVKGFLRYIFSTTYKLYTLYKDYFNAYYSFEEFFYDGITLALEIYDNNYNNFSAYLKYFYLRMVNIIRRTYFLNVSTTKWREIVKTKEARKRIVELNGDLPTIEELSKITGYSVRKVQKCYDQVPLDEEEIPVTYEDGIVDEIDRQSLHSDIMKILELFPPETREKNCQIYGIVDEYNLCMEHQMLSRVGREHQVTGEAIRQTRQKVLSRFAQDKDFMDKYR